MTHAIYSHFIHIILFSVVEFAHRSDMEYALRKLDDAELNGQRIRLFEVCIYHFYILFDT